MSIIKTDNSKLLRGFDDVFAPHSRYTGVDRRYIEENQHLEIIAESEDAGYIAASNVAGRYL